MSKKVIKIENLFKAAETWLKKFFTNRFLLYRIIGIGALFIIVAGVSTAVVLWRKSQPSEAALPKPIAYWSFDEGYASTTYDRIGTNNGTLQSNATWVDGKFGKALSFDGTDDYISFTSTNYGTTHTVSFWVKTSTANKVYIGNAPDAYAFYNSSGNTYYYSYGSSAKSITGGPSILDNQWHFVSVVRENTSIKMYIDAVAIGSNTLAANTNLSLSLIGREESGFYFKGLMDEVKIYGYALSAAEVDALYTTAGATLNIGQSFTNDKFGDPGTVSDSLVAYWKFDETTAWGSTVGAVKDSSGMNNNGTSTNATTTTDKVKYGRSAGFDGNADYIDIDDGGSSGIFNFTNTNNFTFSYWLYLRGLSAQTVPLARGTFESDGWYTNIETTGIIRFLTNTSGVDSSISSPASTITTGTWYHIVGVKNGSESRIYVNGSIVAAGTLSDAATANDALHIGSYPTTSLSVNGYLDDVKIFNRALTENEVTREYVSGPGPVGYWRFEEQTGTVAYDASGNFNNATNTAALMPAWTSGGKIGGALSFNGSSNYLMAPNNATTNITSNQTVSVWVKSSTYVASADIVQRWANDAATQKVWRLATATLYGTASVFLRVSSDGTTNSREVGVVSSSVIDGKWHNINAVYDGSAISFYLDGALASSTPYSSGLYSYPSNKVIIGTCTTVGAPCGSGSYFNGLIDEVKIYNYARDSRQIMQDYNGGGPVAYWSFEEGYASTTYDGSGNNNTLTLQDNTLWTLSGKVGKALTFDGTNDQLSGATNGATSFGSTESHTYEAWVKWNGGTGNRWIIHGYNSTNGTALALSTGNPAFWYQGGSTNYSPSPAISSGAWHHIAASYDGVANKVKIYVDSKLHGTSGTLGSWSSTAFTRSIGGVGAFYFDGSIDDVKIYNYARTPEEVLQDYNSGGGASGKSSNIVLGAVRNSASTWDDGGFGGDAPVAYWRFEEQTGTVAYDSSGNGRIATNTTALMPTWTVVGKAGGALSFNGTTNGIYTMPNSAFTPSNITISLWVSPKSLPTSGNIVGLVDKRDPVLGNSGYVLELYNNSGTQTVYWLVAQSAFVTNYTLPLNAWTHLALTQSGTAGTLYINGALNNTGSAAALVDYVKSLFIGQRSDGYYFDGKIDEVRIYNYVRTAAQLNWEYKQSRPGGG